ncbi:hypothetical protein LSH36_492g08019 [Paralvinella palmiformis]|uniref:Uncharacterized protein n=1 Tax=Paralvinella palmiformis TaxID=53620 RepID=A0AAD9MWZ8_9ANNE|nr:hypothetical protein LSH36_492g08019 [Paralvinella palmiformis]
MSVYPRGTVRLKDYDNASQTSVKGDSGIDIGKDSDLPAGEHSLQRIKLRYLASRQSHYIPRIRPLLLVYFGRPMARGRTDRNRLRETKHYIGERNQYALPEFKQKRQNPANKAHLANGILYVKGRLQSKFLTSTLSRVDSADENIPNVTIATGDKITDGGSTFTGYAADVTDIEDVSVVLEQSLKLDGIAAATHRIYAYRHKEVVEVA